VNWLHELVAEIVREALTESLTMPPSVHQSGALRAEADNFVSGGESPRRLKAAEMGIEPPTEQEPGCPQGRHKGP